EVFVEISSNSIAEFEACGSLLFEGSPRLDFEPPFAIIEFLELLYRFQSAICVLGLLDGFSNLHPVRVRVRTDVLPEVLLDRLAISFPASAEATVGHPIECRPCRCDIGI